MGSPLCGCVAQLLPHDRMPRVCSAPAVAEAWGSGDGTVYGMEAEQWRAYGAPREVHDQELDEIRSEHHLRLIDQEDGHPFELGGEA